MTSTEAIVLHFSVIEKFGRILGFKNVSNFQKHFRSALCSLIIIAQANDEKAFWMNLFYSGSF